MSIQDHTLGELLRMASYDNLKKTYKQNSGEGKKVDGRFNQNQKEEIIRPIEKPEPLEPAPVVIEDDDPYKNEREDLERKIREILAEQAEIERKLGEKQPEFEAPKKELSLIKPLSMVLIDPIRADAQDVHGAQAVQARYGLQNDKAWMVKPFARKTKDAKKALAKGGWTVGKIAASSVRHPIATAQNIVRDPYENRDIHFAYAVNEMIKKKLFPNNSEMALLVPDSFIDYLLVKGREKRNEKIPKQVWNAIKDFLPGVSTGFSYDTQQKRALEILNELINADPDGLLADIENKTLKDTTKLAQRFSQTFIEGDKLLPDQKRIGDSQILFPEEKRIQIETKDEHGVNLLEKEIKEKIKPFVDSDTTMTLEEKKQLVKDVTQIYLSHTPKEKLDKNGKPKGEAVIDVLALIEDLKKDSYSLEFYRDPDNWSNLKIISYLGESKGDTLGGQERFLTWNQKLAIKSAKAGESVTRGSAGPALGAVVKIGAYSLGFGISYLTGVSKVVPRTALGGVMLAVSPFLGPAVAGSVAGLTESQSVHLGRFYRRNSRVDTDLTRTSRGKALGEKTGEIDVVRGDLEKATVETVPAETLTAEINRLILSDPNDFSSETRTPANKEEVLKLLINMAHARARLDLTMQSGTENLDYKTSNWVSYHAGREQEELTNLTGAICQSLARLMRLQVETPTLFDGLPFLPTSNGDLNEALKSMTTVVMAGLREGMPDNLLLGTTPLSDFKSQKFYKQIFNASGIPETETQQVFDFINSLQSTDKINDHSISDWMKESESFRSRMKVLKKIRDTRFRFAAGTGFVSSLVMGKITTEVKEHVTGPVMAEVKSHLTPSHQPQPIAPVSPDQPPAPALETAKIIDFSTIFVKHSNEAPQQVIMWDKTTDAPQGVNIHLAPGYRLDFDGENYDLKHNDTTVYEDFLIPDKSLNHAGAFAPNSNLHFDQSEFLKSDFSQLGIEKGGEPVELTGGAAIVQFLKTHYKEAMSTIAHRDVYKEQHALTTFIDQDGKVHITQGGYSAQNVSGGPPQSMSAGLEGGNGALWFTFGKNADGSATPGVPLSFEGIKVALTWHQKGDGGYGEYVFDPHHPDLNNPQEVLLAKLIDQQALDKFQAMGSDHWLNEKDLGELWMGIRGYEGGYMTMTPDGPKMHDFEMEFAGENNPLTIAPPDHVTATPVIEMLPPQSVEVPVENPPIIVPSIKTATKQINPLPANFTAFPGPYHSPQLHPTIGEENIPVSSTPLRQSIINTNEFKKESQPDGYDNQKAFDFLNTGAIKTEEQIDGFIFDKVFNQRQEEYLKSEKAKNFIDRTLLNDLKANKKNIYTKITNPDIGQLTPEQRTELKTEVSKIGKANGLTSQEALNIYDYLSHMSYIRSLNSAVQEKKELDRQLQDAESQLNSLHSSRPIPTGPPALGAKPLTENERAKKIDDIASRLVRDNLQILSNPSSDIQAEALRKISQEAQEAVIKEFLNDAQRDTFSKLPADTMEKVIKKLNDAELFRKIQSWESLEPQEKMELKKTISQELTRPEDAEVFYLFLTNFNILTSELKKKIESEQKPEKELFETFLKMNRIPYKDEQIKFIGSNNFNEFMDKVHEKIYGEGLSIYTYQLLTSEEIRKLRETILEIANGQISKDNAEITINYLLFQNDSIVREINQEIEGLTRLMIQDDSSLLSDHTTDAAKIVGQKRFEQFIQNITDPKQIKIIEGLSKNIMQDVLDKARGVNEIVANDDDIVFDKIYKLELLDSQEKEKLKQLINQVLNGEEAEALYTFLVNSNHVASQVKQKIEEKRKPLPETANGEKVVNGNQLFKLSASKKGQPDYNTVLGYTQSYLAEILGVDIENVTKNTVVIRPFKDLVESLLELQSNSSGPLYQEIEDNLNDFNRMMSASGVNFTGQKVQTIEALLMLLNNVKFNQETRKVIFPEDNEDHENIAPYMFTGDEILSMLRSGEQEPKPRNILKQYEKYIIQLLTLPKDFKGQIDINSISINLDQTVEMFLDLLLKYSDDIPKAEMAEFENTFNEYLKVVKLRFPAHSPRLSSARSFIRSNPEILYGTTFVHDDKTKTMLTKLPKEINIYKFVNKQKDKDGTIIINESDLPVIKPPDITVELYDLDDVPESPDAHENGGGELRKSFEEYKELDKNLAKLKHEMDEIQYKHKESPDEFAYLSDDKYIEASDKVLHINEQINQLSQSISKFEIEELPIILGGTFDTIIVNPKDIHQDVHGYYYHEFRNAFREYMLDYVTQGRTADNGAIRTAFEKLKKDLSDIDPSVKIVKFEEFMDKIRASV